MELSAKDWESLEKLALGLQGYNFDIAGAVANRDTGELSRHMLCALASLKGMYSVVRPHIETEDMQNLWDRVMK